MLILTLAKIFVVVVLVAIMRTMTTESTMIIIAPWMMMMMMMMMMKIIIKKIYPFYSDLDVRTCMCRAYIEILQDLSTITSFDGWGE